MVTKTDRRQDDEDANPFDERGVLKDHRSYRVPMYAMDALSRDVAQHFAGVTDATGDGGLGLHSQAFASARPSPATGASMMLTMPPPKSPTRTLTLSRATFAVSVKEIPVP
jgi:hypothetical protein